MTDKNRKNDIVLICDDEYRVPTLVTVYSILQAKQEDSNYRVNIIVHTKDISNYRIFQQMSATNFEIRLIPVDENILETKFHIPELIRDVAKVLYLDSDIIVKKDFTELFDIDLSTKYGAVVVDSEKLYSERNIVKTLENYFNSGVMLLNTERMRGVIDELVVAKQKKTDKAWMVQDVFNEVFSTEVITLPMKYNCMYTNLVRSRKKCTLDTLNQLYGTCYNNLRQIYNDAVMVHFSSKDKPWKCVESPMARLWYACYCRMRRYAEKSGFDTDILEAFEKALPDDMRLKNALTYKNKMGQYCCEPEMIVSFTTIPTRIDTVYWVVLSLLSQTEIPDRIQLWLGEEFFVNMEKDLPSKLLDLKKDGLEILWCQDRKSHTKYYRAMKDNPNAVVITVDDDIFYEDFLISTLVKSYYRYPEAVSAMRAHACTFDSDGNLKDYDDWKQQIEHGLYQPNMALLATGVGGVLYPPKSLHEDLFDTTLANELCPTTDDLWLKIMAVRNGTTTVLAYPNYKQYIIEGTQKRALYKINHGEGKNDRHFRQTLAYYEVREGNAIKEDLYKGYLQIEKELEKPIVSVVLPICNPEANIQKCLDSLLKQSLAHIEIIIVNNGSERDTIQQYAEKNNKIIVMEQNACDMGQAANIGLCHANGKYIVFASANIAYEENWLCHMYAKIAQDDADIAICKIDSKDNMDDKMYKTKFLLDNKWEVDAGKIVFLDEVLGHDARDDIKLQHDISCFGELRGEAPQEYVAPPSEYTPAANACLQGAETIYIYGAGVYGKKVYDSLVTAQMAHKVRGWIVSALDDGSDTCMDLPVYAADTFAWGSAGVVILAMKQDSAAAVIAKCADKGYDVSLYFDGYWLKSIEEDID